MFNIQRYSQNLTQPYSGQAVNQNSNPEINFNMPMQQQLVQNNSLYDDFYENLAASKFDRSLEMKLKRQIDMEFDARKAWFSKITSGLNALGIVEDMGQTPNSQTQTTNVNSTFMQTMLKMVAQFSEELFQINNVCVGQVKNPKQFEKRQDGTQILSQLEDMAQLAAEDINTKISYEYDDFMKQLERGLQSCFLTGSAVFKVYYDEMLRRPVVRFIRPEHVLISKDAPSLHSTEFVCHIFSLTKSQVEAYIESGFFVNVDFLGSPDEITYAQTVERTRSKIAGQESISNSNDTMFPIYWFGETEMLVSARQMNDQFVKNNPNYNLEIKNGVLPYRIISHLDTGRWVHGGRAWEKEKVHEIKRNSSLAHIQMLPGDNFWGMGLNDTSLQQHNLATTLEREFVTATRLCSAPVIMVDKNLIAPDSNIQLTPGSFISVNTVTSNVNEGVRPLPFTPPTPMLMEKIQDIEQKISSPGGIITQTYESIPSNTDASVLLSLMDREQKPMSGVLKRIITGVNYMLEQLKRIMAEDMGDRPFGDGDLGLTNRQVYGSKIQLLSACNPSMASSSVRIVQKQLLLQYALQAPQLHNMLELYNELYGAIHIENIHKILITEEQYQEQQQQQQQAAQQQNQAAMQQQEFDNQQKAFQNSLIDKDLQLKAEKDRQQLILKYMEMTYKYNLEKDRLVVELMKEKGENIKQYNSDITALYKAFGSIELERKRLESELGIHVPLPDPLPLKEFNIDESALINITADPMPPQIPILNDQPQQIEGIPPQPQPSGNPVDPATGMEIPLGIKYF